MRLALAALLAIAGPAMADDGDPDPTFAGDGKAWFGWPTTYEGEEVIQVTARGIAVLADGSTVTAGTIDTIGPNRFQAAAVAKFKLDGTVDESFGMQGWQLAYFEQEPNKDTVLGIFPSAGNSMLVVGVVESMARPFHRPGLVKLRANGALDTNFGQGGKLIIDAQPFGAEAGLIYRGAIQAPDGKIVLFGSCVECGHGVFDDFMALRLNANGSVDTGFGTAGWVSVGRSDDDDHYLPEVATAAAVDTQGRVVLGGYSESYEDPDHRQQPLLVRTTPDGQLDTTFNGTGYVDINLLGSFETSSIAIDPYNDGIVLAANIAPTQGVVPGTLLVRTRRDGTADANFGDGGFVVLQYEEGTHITALAIRRDRRITAAGWIDPDGIDTRDFLVARTHFTGALDSSFDGNGVNRYAFDFAPNSEDEPSAMILSGERPMVVGLLTLPDSDEFATGVLRLQSDAIFEDGFD
jgi:uncharacterized delta-60 repeat protein